MCTLEISSCSALDASKVSGSIASSQHTQSLAAEVASKKQRLGMDRAQGCTMSDQAAAHQRATSNYMLNMHDCGWNTFEHDGHDLVWDSKRSSIS